MSPGHTSPFQLAVRGKHLGRKVTAETNDPLLGAPLPAAPVLVHSAVKGVRMGGGPSGRGLGVVSGNMSLWGHLLWNRGGS